MTLLSGLDGSPAGRIKRRFWNSWLHDVDGRSYLRRLTIAKDAGLDERSVEHYPVAGDTTTTTINKGGLVTALAVVSLALSIVAAAWLLRPVPQPVTPSPHHPVTHSPPPAAAKPQEFIVTFWAEDGEQIKPE